MAGINPYETLDLSPDATAAEIEAAGRKAAKATHPDKPGGDAGKFSTAMRALAILRDPKKRENYDATGEVNEDPEDLCHAQALSIISHKLLGLIGAHGFDPASGDVLAEIRGALHADKRQALANKAENERILKRFGEFRRRLKSKSGQTNPMIPVLDVQIGGVKAAIIACDKDVERMNTALEIVADFLYERDQDPVSDGHGSPLLRYMTLNSWA